MSWGKVKGREGGGRMVKVYAEASVVFPLIVAATWARVGDGRRSEGEGKAE